ncbi:MAG: MFS transporter [Bacteroidia bacterium]|nr:MFS transporter [Bacteroidia bacterium]
MRSYTLPIALFCLLYFLAGFIASQNDILNPLLKDLFGLAYREAALVHFSFFLAFALLALPAGLLADRYGPRRAVEAGLLLSALGAAGFWPAAASGSYWAFLPANFVLAAGMAILMVVANSAMTYLGPQASATGRLNLGNAFNSVGASLGPLAGSLLLAGGGLARIWPPYLVMAGLLLALAFGAAQIQLPHPERSAGTQPAPLGSLLRQPRIAFGVLAIFCYGGIEIGAGSLIVKYLGMPHIAGMAPEEAGRYVSLYWGGSMAGRFAGGLLFRNTSPRLLLSRFGTAGVLCSLVVILGSGAWAQWSLIALGLCNSVLFASVFTYALQGLGADTQRAGGLLMTGVLGSSVLPVLQGAIADAAGLQPSFILTMLCYGYLVFYGLRKWRAG